MTAAIHDSFFEYDGGIYHGPSFVVALRELVLAVSVEDPEAGWSEALAAAHSRARRMLPERDKAGAHASSNADITMIKYPPEP